MTLAVFVGAITYSCTGSPHGTAIGVAIAAGVVCFVKCLAALGSSK